MAYVPPRKIYRLDFADTDFDGMQVSLYGLNTRQLIDAQEKTAVAESDAESSEFRELLELMIEKFHSWNVGESEDGPSVPPTLDFLYEQDPDFNLAIVNAWTTAIVGVPAPLDNDSPSGDPSLEASIPMETLSLSPESSAVPA
ncbi:MAG TPA: hypothetical protein VHU40_06295 [Polyangia bacterium]|jgi:hypothetical protein|nr:hypothetical protein [Polyangia bacterium]